ncbi:MAG: GH3 auxin-responsive promoter family protein, partial [Xanthomarina gelatinilytica]|nr:GH3 auxin-responsive promoter family protein [Xanthomarina gelatinilytica]
PASEGFFAFQDKQDAKGMLLQLNSGIFYEFIKADEFFTENPKRLTIKDVELGVNYVLIVSTNAGLWAYNVGDTVEFTSLKPYRVIVSGRIKHFISAFGEHVIGKEVEQALQEAVKNSKVQVTEFTVAPQINPEKGLPYHEWFIEFESEPSDFEAFSKKIDASLQKQNSYYFDLINGKVLQPLKITQIKKNGFQEYMKSIGKLGGQNKIARLSNDRNIANVFEAQNLIK